MLFKVLKKVKHRLVESMNSSTADTLGLSRAILCNGHYYTFKYYYYYYNSFINFVNNYFCNNSYKMLKNFSDILCMFYIVIIHRPSIREIYTFINMLMLHGKAILNENL